MEYEKSYRKAVEKCIFNYKLLSFKILKFLISNCSLKIHPSLAQNWLLDTVLPLLMMS